MAIASFNNSLLVGQTEFKVGKYTEENSIYSWYKKDTFKHYKGMLHLWNQRKYCTTPLLNMTEMQNNVIYVNGAEGAFDYSVPYELGLPYIVENLQPADLTPGLGGDRFKIKLSENCYTNTDRITWDYQYGKELYITEEEIYEDNGGWIYTVELVTEDRKNDYFPIEKLEPGTKFMKVSNSNGEFSTQKSSISSRFGEMKLQTKMSGHRSAYHWITGYANMLNVNSAGLQKLTSMYGDLNKKDSTLVLANTDKNGQPIKGTAKWITMIEAMLWAEMKQMEENDLMWSKGGVVYGEGRRPIQVGKGLFEQMKAGQRYKYTKVTKSLLDSAFGRLFTNTGIKLEDRHVEVQCGMGALLEVSRMIEHEFGKLPFAINVGKDSGLNIITGERNNLGFGYRFTNMQFPTAGNVTFVHNPAFDAHQNRSADNLVGEYPNFSYTMAIFDVTDSNVSNAAAKMTSKHRIEDGFNEGSNIAIIKPEGRGGVTWGYEIGTEPPPGFTGQGLVSSSQRDGYAIWMKSFSSIWLKDATRTILLERNIENL